jgi:hypothetical protein
MDRATASSDRTGVGARRYSVAMARRTPLGRWLLIIMCNVLAR